ncbi:MAG: helix-turn-helix domain-containing protein [Pseudomonadota bacterium]
MHSAKAKRVSAPEINVEASGFQVSPKDAWQFYAPAYDYVPITHPCNTSLITNQVWSTPGCVFGQQTVSASLYDHTKKHVNETGYLVCVHRFISGGSFGLSGDHPYSTPPRTIGFRDYSTPYKGIQMPGVSQGIYIVADQIGFDPSRQDGQISYAEHTTFGRVLNAEFDHFFGHLNDGATALDLRRVKRLIACFTLAVNGPSASMDVRLQARNALHDTICDYIEQHLQSPDLTPTHLVRRFGVSRPTLFRMFEEDGGVRTYISRRRLLHAMIDLASNPTLRGQISNVAERWGYSSIPNFHRTIKSVFGVSPGSLFEHPVRDWPPTRRGSVFSDFVHTRVLRRVVRSEAMAV